MPFGMKTVIFDLDGTLADTSHDLLAAANAVFDGDGLGRPLTHKDHAGVALRGGRAMLTKGAEVLGLDWDAAAIDQRYQPLLEHYESALDVHTVLYPDAIEVIDGLIAAGWAVGICTNKPEALAEALIESLGVRDRFGALIGADTLPVRKPDPLPLFETIKRAGGDPARAALVGDTITDHSTARAAGVASILVTFGPGEDVTSLAPDALLPNYRALPTVLDRLIA